MDIHEHRVAAPASEPLTIEQVKADRVVTHTEHDGLFTGYIQAAREMAESRTGRALITQEWRQTIPFNQLAEIPLIKWPVQELLSVSVDGVDIDLATLEFLPGDDAIVSGNQLLGGRVQVVYRAGYGSAGDVPAALKKWMLLQIGSMYETRESEVIGSVTSRVRYTDGLLAPFIVRRYW